MNHHVYRDPLKAIGNADDLRVNSPDQGDVSLIGLNRGILAAVQNFTPGGGGGGGGDASAANQVAANALLTSIDTKTPAAPATAALQGATNDLLTSIDSKVGTGTLPTGAATAANQATGNATLTTIDAKLAAIDAKLALDAAVASASLTSVASGITSAQVLAANANRKGLLLVNDDANTVYVKYGTAASATSYTVALVTGAYWEMPRPIYTGIIHALWAANGTGSLQVTEL